MNTGLIEAEERRRFAMWDALKKAGRAERLSPSAGKEAGVHRGQQGIYRDQQAQQIARR